MHIINYTETRQVLPSRFIFFDTETLPKKVLTEYIKKEDRWRVYERHDLRLGVAIFRDFEKGKREVLWFRTAEEFWAFVFKHMRKKDKLYLVAHNINFDLNVVQYERFLKKEGWKVVRRKVRRSSDSNDYSDVMYFKGHVFYMEVERDGYRLAFLNSGNFFPGSLKALGEAIGYDKFEMPDWEKSDQEWFIYCERDVEILERMFENYLKFLKEEDLGSFSITLASQALRAFYKRFCPVTIIHHDIPEVTHLEREAYHGGRTECFRIGQFNQKIYYVDVNSLYPFVMRNNKYPVKLLKYSIVSNPDEIKWLLDNDFLVIADVYIETDYPIVPKKIDGQLIAPVGRFRTVISTPELKLVLKYGRILKVFSVAVYEGEYLFKDYVDYFYQKKSESKGVYRLMYKLFLNSLYGKFAQKIPKWRTIDEYDGAEDLDPYEIVTMGDKRINIRRIWGLVQMSVPNDGVDSFHSFTAIAAHVTAYAWAYMSDILVQIKPHVYYMDTDSFFITEEGYKWLEQNGYLDDKELGKFKLEGVLERAVFYAPKDYQKVVDGVAMEVIKGVTKGARKIREGVYEVYQFPSPAGLLRIRKKGLKNSYYAYKTVKVLKRQYKKGVVRYDGVVEPIRLEEIY